MDKLKLYSLLEPADVPAAFRDAFTRMEEQTTRLGFEFVAIGAASSLPVTSPKVFIYNNYPPAWREIYCNQRLFVQDSAVWHCIQDGRPLIWSSTVKARSPAFWRQACDNGICEGVSQSGRLFDGSTFMVSICRARGPVTAQEWKQLKMPFSYLYYQTSEALVTLKPFEAMQLDLKALSQREIEAIRWAGMGKTAEETAMIMGLKTKTVQSYLANACKKLQARTISHAVVKATVLGLV